MHFVLLRDKGGTIEGKRHFLHQIMTRRRVIFDQRLLLGVLQHSLTQLGNSYHSFTLYLPISEVRVLPILQRAVNKHLRLLHSGHRKAWTSLRLDPEASRDAPEMPGAVQGNLDVPAWNDRICNEGIRNNPAHLFHLAQGGPGNPISQQHPALPQRYFFGIRQRSYDLCRWASK